jgi:uncharacterized protein (UPF0333 family)
MIEPKQKDMEVDMVKAKGSLQGEDLLVVSALWVVVLIAIGIVAHGVDATIGSAIIAALAAAAGIAKVIKSRRRGSKEADNGDAEG